MPAAQVELYIDSIVVYGIAAGERDRFEQAVQAALTELLVQTNFSAHLPQAETTVQQMNASISPAARTDALGEQVGKAVYGSVVRAVGASPHE